MKLDKEIMVRKNIHRATQAMRATICYSTEVIMIISLVKHLAREIK